MAITGGVKFFEKTKALTNEGATMTMTSGEASSIFATDQNELTHARSLNSTDAVTETWELDFGAIATINRLLLIDINWKDFSVRYDVSGVWTSFASVIGLDGSLVGIVETAFADTTGYYEFASVTTQKLQFVLNKTQTANQEKRVATIIPTLELGTLQGFPEVLPRISRNIRDDKVLSGRVITRKSNQVFRFDIKFKRYPTDSTITPDTDLMMDLFDGEETFIVWICGGRRGTDFFRYTLRGFRLQDAIHMQVTKDLKPAYHKNIYTAPYTINFRFIEVSL